MSPTPTSRIPEAEADADPQAIGVILAGGASRRMGRDKTGLHIRGLDGLSLLEWAAFRMDGVVSAWVVADNGRCLLADAESVPDGLGAGPASGLLGAAARFPGRRLFALACDLPLVPAAVLRRLVDTDGDWVLPVSPDGPEPLCAVYGPRALASLAERAEAGIYRLRDLSDVNPTLLTKRIPSRELARDLPSGLESALFLNTNRPEDLQAAEDLLARRDISRFLRLDSTKR